MDTNTAIYNDVLEVGREKMSEGDYLKLATFLKQLHNTTDVIVFDKIYQIGITLEFDTYNSSHYKFDNSTDNSIHYKIIIDSVHRTVYKGPKKDDIIVRGSENGISFERTIENLVDKLVKLYHFYGIKNIKRSLDNNKIQYFKNFKNFKKFNSLLHKGIDDGDSDSDDEECCAFTDGYMMKCLCGLHYNMCH